jgi:thiamine-phosphate pyrophosphorylase
VIPRLWLVTPEGIDEPSLGRLCAAAASVCPQDVLVMARAKGEPSERRRVVLAVAKACTRVGLLFSVNGDVELAAETSASWFHAPGSLPAEGLRERVEAVVGKSVYLSRVAHDASDVRAAASASLDAVMVSPIFEVPGKGAPRGLVALAEARELAPTLGLVALGGVDASRGDSCMRAGANAVAVMRAVFAAEHPEVVLRELHFATRVGPSKC